MIKNNRLSRADWLQAALEALGNHGPSHLTIDRLSENLNVTKGSFYAHFENRAVFSRHLIEFWRDKYTTSVSTAMRELVNLPPEEKLEQLLMHVVRLREMYELAVRSWVGTEPALKDVLEDVDNIRMSTVRGIFREMGFRGSDLELRTHALVVYASFRLSIESLRFKLESVDDIRKICTLLCAK